MGTDFEGTLGGSGLGYSKNEAMERHLDRIGSPAICAISKWIDRDIRPDFLATFVMPFTQKEHDPRFYLSLCTRKAEAALFGQSSLHIKNYDDRCLWFCVNEISKGRLSHAGNGLRLNHWHAVGRFPLGTPERRLMLHERNHGRLSLEERCEAMERALVAASETTPGAFAMRGFPSFADIDVRPYHSVHAAYIFKESGPMYSDYWSEALTGPVGRDHGLFILPHLPNKENPRNARLS